MLSKFLLGEIATGLHLWSDLVLVELRKAPQPERSTFVVNCDHIVKITRAQAAADCQLNTFQQPLARQSFLSQFTGTGSLPLTAFPQQLPGKRSPVR
jgi:hypothetical protein